jgi:hypothetical protein
MMELRRHIEILLLSHDCVIVPNLGGFMAHHVAARYDKADGMFIPPCRLLGFNAQLNMSDSVLAQSYADAYDLSFPEAVRRVEHEVSLLKERIAKNGRYDFAGLGTLSVNSDGRYEFEPCPAGILTPSLYGFGAFEMPLLRHAVPSQVVLDTKPMSIIHPASTHRNSKLATIMSQINDNYQPSEEKTISIKVSLLRNLAVTAVAAVALILFARPVPAGEDVASASTTSEAGMLSLPSHDASSASESTADLSIVGGLEKMSRMIEESQEEGVIPESGAFTIVLAYSLPLENAKMFLSDIKSKGARKAVLMTYNGENVIAYGSYTERGDAYVQLQELIASGSVESGWIMQVK